MKTKEQAMRDRDHVTWLQNPGWWNREVVLNGERVNAQPVIRGKGFAAELAVVVEGGGSTVYFGNVFLGGFSEQNSRKYESFEALVADGWEVD